jgi:PAS domain S-box-containing protein
MFRYRVISRKALSDLAKELEIIKEDVSQATAFVREIEKGNLDASIADTGISTELIGSLLAMRDQMKKYSLLEAERNWANEGLAKFVEVLRSRSDNIEELSDTIIRQLVNYLKVNQGALYLINDEDPSDVFIETVACYAYSRKKYFSRRIELGEGLVGQAVLEKETIYITDVPENYVRITSGLGEALPRNILIVPLKLEDRVYGILEIASFQILKKHEIEFVEKLGESIAATISSVKISARTSKLLKASQEQAEEMRAQEEELRQNMEELTATQEEMRRILKEVEAKEQYVSSLLNVSSDMIFTVDRNFRLVTWNKAMEKSVEGFGVRLEKGFDTMAWYPESEKEQQRNHYRRAFAGETFEFMASTQQKGVLYHFLTVYAPLRDSNSEIFEVAVFSKDVTEMVAARREAELLRDEAQRQADEIRQQGKLLQQNLEEIAAQKERMEQQLIEISDLKEHLEAREKVFGLTTILSESDLYGTITHVNSKFCEVSGYTPEELIGKPHNIVRHPDMPKELFKLLWATIKKGEPFRGIVKNRKKDGGHYWVDATIVPIRNKEGKVVKYIGARYHITNEALAEEMFKAQFKKANGVPA